MPDHDGDGDLVHRSAREAAAQHPDVLPSFSVAVGWASLHLPMSHSLKDRRQVTRALIHKLQNQRTVAVSELPGDRWQRADIALLP